MKAMILAAGLGTRLKPHTLTKPKALVEINGKPLIAYCIDKLISSGFNHIVVNVHHFAEQIVQFLSDNKFDADIYISDETDCLLDTGGGIARAEKFLMGDESFLVHNVDILSNINLLNLYRSHLSSNAWATLAVSKRKSSRALLFDSSMQLSGWINYLTNEQIISRKCDDRLNPFAFSGIHVISPDFFAHFSDNKPFSIIKGYLNIAASRKIIGIEYPDAAVIDAGTTANLAKAEAFIRKSS